MMNLIYFYIGFVTWWGWWLVVGWVAIRYATDFLIEKYSEKPKK